MSKYSLDMCVKKTKNFLIVLVVKMIAEQQQKKKFAVVPSESHNVELKHGVLK